MRRFIIIVVMVLGRSIDLHANDSLSLNLGNLAESSSLVGNYKLETHNLPLGTLKSVNKSCGCITVIKTPLGRLFEQGEAIPLTMIFNTVGKPERFHTNLAFTFTNHGKDISYLVDVTGTVEQRFTVNSNQLAFGTLNIGDKIERTVSISNYKHIPITLGASDAGLSCEMVGDAVKIGISCKSIGLYNENFELRQGDLVKTFVVTWAVKSPICDQVALIQGLVESNSPHNCSLILKYSTPFHVQAITAKSGKLNTSFVAESIDSGLSEQVNLTYSYPDKGSFSDMIAIRTSLSKPNDVIDIPFSALFYKP